MDAKRGEAIDGGSGSCPSSRICDEDSRSGFSSTIECPRKLGHRLDIRLFEYVLDLRDESHDAPARLLVYKAQHEVRVVAVGILVVRHRSDTQVAANGSALVIQGQKGAGLPAYLRSLSHGLIICPGRAPRLFDSERGPSRRSLEISVGKCAISCVRTRTSLRPARTCARCRGVVAAAEATAIRAIAAHRIRSRLSSCGMSRLAARCPECQSSARPSVLRGATARSRRRVMMTPRGALRGPVCLRFSEDRHAGGVALLVTRQESAPAVSTPRHATDTDECPKSRQLRALRPRRARNGDTARRGGSRGP